MKRYSALKFRLTTRRAPLQKIGAVLLVSFIAVAHLGVVSVAAESATFGQKILPMNCVFETVNDGTGTLRYLTPAECGVIVEPEPELPGGTPSQLPSERPAQQLPKATPQDAGRPVFFLPNNPGTSASDAGQKLPWRPIATVDSQDANSSKTAATKSSSTVMAAVGIGLVTLIVLVVLVF